MAGHEGVHVALLCGVNVGGHRKVPMAELRRLMGEDLGWSGVRTHLQSGNAVFRTADPAPRERLERALAGHFGFEVRCVLRTAAELEAEVAACPFPVEGADPAKLLMLFLGETPEPGHFDALDPAAYAPDEFRRTGRVVYCRFPDG